MKAISGLLVVRLRCTVCSTPYVGSVVGSIRRFCSRLAKAQKRVEQHAAHLIIIRAKHLGR